MGRRPVLLGVGRCCGLLLLLGAFIGGGPSAFAVSTASVLTAGWPSAVLETPLRETWQRRVSLWDDFAAFLVSDARQHWTQRWMDVARGLAQADSTLRRELDNLQSVWPIAPSATRWAPLGGPWWVVPMSDPAAATTSDGQPQADADAPSEGGDNVQPPSPLAAPVAAIQGFLPVAADAAEERSPEASSPITDPEGSQPLVAERAAESSQPEGASGNGAPAAGGEGGQAPSAADDQSGARAEEPRSRESSGGDADGGRPAQGERAGSAGEEDGRQESPADAWQTVVASWYGPGFYGRPTASGEIFTGRDMTAAHRTMPFGTLLVVRYPATGRSVQVRINDRGPFVRGRDLDLSEAAAEALGMVKAGVARVQMRVLRWGSDGGR